jgi:hypothetical protein
VLIDKPGESLTSFMARSSSQAPDIDSCVWIRGEKLHLGQFVTAKVKSTQGYDLVAEPARAKNRALPVLSH